MVQWLEEVNWVGGIYKKMLSTPKAENIYKTSFYMNLKSSQQNKSIFNHILYEMVCLSFIILVS